MYSTNTALSFILHTMLSGTVPRRINASTVMIRGVETAPTNRSVMAKLETRMLEFVCNSLVFWMVTMTNMFNKVVKRSSDCSDGDYQLKGYFVFQVPNKQRIIWTKENCFGGGNKRVPTVTHTHVDNCDLQRRWLFQRKPNSTFLIRYSGILYCKCFSS